MIWCGQAVITSKLFFGKSICLLPLQTETSVNDLLVKHIRIDVSLLCIIPGSSSPVKSFSGIEPTVCYQHAYAILINLLISSSGCFDLNQIALLRDAFPTFASLAKAVPLRGSLFCCMSMFHSCSQMQPVLFSNPAFSFTLVITT